MPIVSDLQLKQYFETGDIPTQQQFENLIDSKVNVNDIFSYTQIQIGATNVIGAGAGEILYSDGASLQSSNKFIFDYGNSRLGVNASTPQGAIGIYSANGNSDATGLGIYFQRPSGTINTNTAWGFIRTLNGAGLTVGTFGLFQQSGGGGTRFTVATTNLLTASATERFRVSDNGFVSIGTSMLQSALLDIHALGSLPADLTIRVRNVTNTLNVYELRGDNSIVHYSNATPTAPVTDGYILYGRDANGGGTTAPHFLTEDNKTIKLYQYNNTVGSATHVPIGATNIHLNDTYNGYTIQQIVQVLTNLGILA